MSAAGQRSTKRCACGVLLEPGEFRLGLCFKCSRVPGARDRAAAAAAAPPPFGVAGRSLIGKLHGYMPVGQLLSILNQRLVADAGEGTTLHTLEQLHAELTSLPAANDAGDWAGLRQVLGRARRDGLLELVDGQVIDDFAVVFSLSSAQVLRLKDVVMSAKGRAS